jgi:hypothetical protein
MYLGETFNELNKHKKFYKILNGEENHNGFQYHDGLNIDINKFNPINECEIGGLYFSDLTNIARYLNYGIWIREVILPIDALIYVEHNKYKADKIILKEKILISDFHEWNNYKFCKLAVQQNGLTLQFVKIKIKEKYEEICELAILSDPYAIQFVKSEDISLICFYELCVLAVSKNGYALQYIKIPAYEECKLIGQNVSTPQYIVTVGYVFPEFLPEEICKIAVQQNGFALQFMPIENKTYEIYKLAIQQNGFVLQFVSFENQTYEMCKLAIQQNGYALKYVSPEYITHELYDLAGKQIESNILSYNGSSTN